MLLLAFFAYPCPRGKADCGIVTAIGIYRQLSRETALSWKNITPVPKESRVTSNWAALSQLSQFGSLPPSKSSSFSTGFSTLVGSKSLRPPVHCEGKRADAEALRY